VITLPKRQAPVVVTLDGRSEPVAIALEGGYEPMPDSPDNVVTAAPIAGPSATVPLAKLAYARSGDKGNISNIGVIARRPEYLPLILDQLTPAVVKEYFAHLVRGEVRRYLLPGIHACNFLLHDALDGGGTASLRMDPLGKGMAQMLLDLPLRVPSALAAKL
jgi:hypothetical protein